MDIQQAAEKDPYADCPEHHRRLRSIASREFVFVWRVRARADFTVTIQTRSRFMRASPLDLFQQPATEVRYI